MNVIPLIFNWKTILAVALGSSCIILASKVPPEDAKEAVVGVTSAVSDGVSKLL